MKEVKASWLQISDLHVNFEADTVLMLDDYKKLSNIISPQFLIVTGDFRHLQNHTDFSLAKDYMEKVLNIFHISKKDVFLVPGNHDVNNFEKRKDMILNICRNTCPDQDSHGNYNYYAQYVSGTPSLYDGFREYVEFARDFYKGTGVDDDRYWNPEKTYCIVWNGILNILCINTVLISDDNKPEKHAQIVDINTLASCEIDVRRPTIMLGHHGLDSLYKNHKKRVEGLIDRKSISAYLHGDGHQYENNPVEIVSIPNKTIPSIACAKSAPESGDNFSDIGVIYYEWHRDDDNTYFQAFRWETEGFKEDSRYYYNINKQSYFPMLYDKRCEGKYTEEYVDKVYNQIKGFLHDKDLFLNTPWVTEAEEIWEISENEGIGRCLLTYYMEKSQGRRSAPEYKKAIKIIDSMKRKNNLEPNTEMMLRRINQSF